MSDYEDVYEMMTDKKALQQTAVPTPAPAPATPAVPTNSNNLSEELFVDTLVAMGKKLEQYKILADLGIISLCMELKKDANLCTNYPESRICKINCSGINNILDDY